ncbi:MAG: TIM barrel protein [Deltaproteobacteria bacterium]|nr:TIM barrel protein [Deltaproteobacteria bacterium]
MEKLLFGTGGSPHSSKTQTTIDGIKRIAELGLGCMELEFVYGVRMGEAGARLVAETARSAGVRLSAHGPYYINLNAREEEKVAASQQRILQTARIAAVCGAQSVTFHAAFYLGDPPEKTYRAVKKNLAEVLNQLKKENNPVVIRPEVMGKPSAFGTLDEVLKLCAELKSTDICMDFAHWHAYSGEANSYAEFASTLEQIKEKLGDKALADMHIHVSGIAYGKKGELKHLNLKESDLRYVELIQALKDYKAKGLVICESPSLEEDALLLQETYHKL